MPKVRLNEMGLRSLKPPSKGQVDYWDDGLPGFGCRVSQGGAKTFLLKHDNRRITLGRYPVISLQNARGEARRLLAEFTLGRIRPQSLAYSEAVKLFLADKAKTTRPRTLTDYKRHLARHFPFKGQLIDVTHAQIAHRLNRLQAVPAEHNHARTVAVIFFNWCKERRYIADNPVVGISAYERKRRARVLTDVEVKKVWGACDSDKLPGHFRTIVRLLILMGQRETETAALNHAWINTDSITLPSEITKNRNIHTFPLGARAREILTAQGDIGLLFPAKNNPHKAFCGWGKAKATLDQISGVTGWTLHDIRRTFRTNLGKLGVAPHIAERLVNHISARTDMERTYDIYSYMPDMRAAIEKWESYLVELLTAKERPDSASAA
jgi:Arm DNA-binding domain/Phage integrase family